MSRTPATPPDYVLEDGAGGPVDCCDSWNGAPDVATWRIVSGSEPDSIVEVVRAPKITFETKLEGVAIAPYMEVQALNSAGLILAGRVLQRGE